MTTMCADTQAARTRARIRTQETILQVLNILSTKLTAKSASSQWFPLQFLCGYANSAHSAQFATDQAKLVLAGNTGKLLEYRHLIKNPRNNDIWK